MSLITKGFGHGSRGLTKGLGRRFKGIADAFKARYIFIRGIVYNLFGKIEPHRIYEHPKVETIFDAIPIPKFIFNTEERFVSFAREEIGETLFERLDMQYIFERSPSLNRVIERGDIASVNGPTIFERVREPVIFIKSAKIIPLVEREQPKFIFDNVHEFFTVQVSN
jgi:hypothetical protein